MRWRGFERSVCGNEVVSTGDNGPSAARGGYGRGSRDGKAKIIMNSTPVADKSGPRRYFDQPAPPLTSLWIGFGMGTPDETLGRAGGKINLGPLAGRTGAPHSADGGLWDGE